MLYLQSNSMKKTIFPILFILLSIHTFAQVLAKNDFIEDLAFLKKTLPTRHTNLFAKIDSPTFIAKIQGIENKVDRLNYETFTTELFKLTVAIGDEHTFIEPKFTKILPIQFDFFKEGLFITAIDSAHSNLLQSQLIAINNKPTSEIVALFKEAIQSYNPSYFDDHFLHFINNPAFLKGLGITNSDEGAEFTIRGKDGKTTQVKLNSFPQATLANLKLALANSTLLAQKKKGNYWFDYDKDKKVVYVNYNKCRVDDSYPFEKFSTELFTAIDQYQPNKIVIDLRYNSGGNSAILDPFIDKIKQSYLNKKGKLFVLIGKQTFSSAVMNAIEFKRNSNAIFIGEPTGGNINHYGEVRGFALPKSKITIAYSTKYWENWKGKKGPLQPDVPVSYSIKNYVAGQDEALQYVYKK